MDIRQIEYEVPLIITHLLMLQFSVVHKAVVIHINMQCIAN